MGWLAKLLRKHGLDPAPGWFVLCQKCGHEVTAESLGFAYNGTRRRRRLFGRCGACAKRGGLVLHKPDRPAAGTERS